MREFADELVMICGVFIAYIILLLVQELEWISLWGSLVVLVLVTFYYSFTFFRASNPLTKFFYFLLFIPMVIGYFALVYKSFGIIDTSNGNLIKPDWLNAMYFSVVTWTTLGYGDFKPVEELKVMVMIEALMGYVFMGLLVGKVLYLSQRQGNKNI